MVLLIGGVYRLGIAGMHTVERRLRADDLAGRFVHTLIPIALAYVVAHYFSLLAYQGQALVYLASDPLGNGTDLFGTTSGHIDYRWIGATGIWYVQVAALVLGHVAGLTLAHDRAIALRHPATRPVAVLDARGDGVVHVLGAVAALGGGDVNAAAWQPVMAHLGHWYVGGPVFLSPVLLVVVFIKVSEWREARRDHEARQRPSTEEDP